MNNIDKIQEEIDIGCGVFVFRLNNADAILVAILCGVVWPIKGSSLILVI